jgi:hypothetical protein
MSLDLTTLALYADRSEAMPASDLLGQQCYDFAVYIERTRWHHSVRDEARSLARRFRATYRLCVQVGQRAARHLSVRSAPQESE